MSTAPYECKHRNSLFVQSRRYTGVDTDHGRDRVEVCPDCGTFFVYGDRNGVHFRVSFTLPTDELVEAAGVYAKRVQEDEAARADEDV